MIGDFWSNELVAHDRQYVFLLLAGFLASFGFIRLSARLMRSPRVPWWPGSVVSDSGVHIHHLVFGIVLMMAAGTIGFAGVATTPWYEVCAAVFGVGMGLTIDEFALWVHLDDVYWASEGRTSIDAMVMAVALMGLILVGASPFDVTTGSAADVVATGILTAIHLGVVGICLAKQRLWHGTIGFFIPGLAIYGASRIGKPGSPWGRRFYGGRNPAKQAKAERRFRPDRRTERFKERLRDAIGGEISEDHGVGGEAEGEAMLDAASMLREQSEAGRGQRDD